MNLQERKRKYDLREIWNVIFYIVKTDCQWRILPSSFAP
ncbi:MULTISPECIES: transposase [Bacteroidaceae]|nr:MULTISPECIES: transposase [Bacteroidaceae]MCR1855843.1 transposase [Phocaeicola vulgatus]UWN81461.1 transposase [Phocaeicola dorei]